MRDPSLCLDYDNEVPSLQAIMNRSRRTQWVVEDVDWELPLGSDDYIRILEWQGTLRSEYIRGLPKKKLAQLGRQMVAFDFSQILHGEQGAMMLAGQLTNTVEDLDARMFAAVQVKDEARHVEAVRAIVERIGPIYPIGDTFNETVNTLLTCDFWPKQVLGLQLFLEARALLSFRQHLMFVDDPVFRDAVLRIERDEAQHVAFGIRYMDRGIEDMTKEQAHDLIEYAKWLDQNVWRLTLPKEYRAPFEECDLDFDEFQMTRPPASPFNLSISRKSRKSAEQMIVSFRKWFWKALERTGILAHAPEEDQVAVQAALQALRGFNPPTAEDREILPWVAGDV